MAFVKCPRCELNYILDGEKLCTVCRREVRGDPEVSDMPELCSECGEHPALPGGELCLACLKEMNRRVAAASDDAIVPSGANIEIDSVATMDEIELDIDEDMEDAPFAEDFDEDSAHEDEDADSDDNVTLDSIAEQEDAAALEDEEDE